MSRASSLHSAVNCARLLSNPQPNIISSSCKAGSSFSLVATLDQWRQFPSVAIGKRRESPAKRPGRLIPKNTKVSFVGEVIGDIRYLRVTLFDGARKDSYGISIEETMKSK